MSVDLEDAGKKEAEERLDMTCLTVDVT